MSEEAAYRMKLREYVSRLQRNPQIDGNTCDAARGWMNNQFAEMEQEKEKNRSGKRSSSLRNRLRNLVMSIIQQFGHDVKGVERNA